MSGSLAGSSRSRAMISDAIADRIGGHYEAALAARQRWPPRSMRALARAAAPSRGAAWLERAAERGLALGARDAAVDLLRRCLALTSRRTARRRRADGPTGDHDRRLRRPARGPAPRRAERGHRAGCLPWPPPGSAERAVAATAYARATDVRADIECGAAPLPRGAGDRGGHAGRARRVAGHPLGAAAPCGSTPGPCRSGTTRRRRRRSRRSWPSLARGRPRPGAGGALEPGRLQDEAAVVARFGAARRSGDGRGRVAYVAVRATRRASRWPPRRGSLAAAR